MKRTKKWMALLLTLILALVMAIPALAAAETGTITLDNPKAGEEYKAYKIFDAKYNDEKTAYSYTISDKSEWYSVVSGFDGVTLEETVIDGTYVVKKKDTFSAAAFAGKLKENLEGKTGEKLKPSGEKVEAAGLDLGYYFVSSGSGALCNLTTTNPSVTIHDKNDVPFEKTDDKTDVQIGETVTYTITGKVPDTTGFDTYTYEIADTMSEGLTFDKDSISVKIADTALNEDSDDYTVTYDVNDNANSFKLGINMIKQKDNIGKAVTVTYRATVNENAVAKVEKNTATLTYSNDPTDGSRTTTTPPEEEKVYSAKIKILKHEAGNEDKTLKDASFILYKNVTTGEGDSQGTTKKYYRYTETSGDQKANVEWVDDKSQATKKTTDEQGNAEFPGLKNGTYYLEETAAPAGYNLLTESVEVTVAGSDTEPAKLTATAKIENNTGTTLPSTGGIGTTIFYVAGGILVIGAAVMLMTRKRVKKEK